MILYFSATGNSRHLALKLAEDLEEKDVQQESVDGVGENADAIYANTITQRLS